MFHLLKMEGNFHTNNFVMSSRCAWLVQFCSFVGCFYRDFRCVILKNCYFPFSADFRRFRISAHISAESWQIRKIFRICRTFVVNSVYAHLWQSVLTETFQNSAYKVFRISETFTKSRGQFWNQSSGIQWVICFHLFWYTETCISNNLIIVQWIQCHIFQPNAQNGFLLFASFWLGTKSTKMIGPMPWLYHQCPLSQKIHKNLPKNMKNTPLGPWNEIRFTCFHCFG